MPGSTQPVDDCNQACPGYPNDHCGSIPNGLFGYIALAVSPSSTAAGSMSTVCLSFSLSSSLLAASHFYHHRFGIECDDLVLLGWPRLVG